MHKYALPCKHKNFSGQTAVEYMLILAAVSSIVLIGFKTYLVQVNKSSGLYYNRVATGVMGKPNPCGDGTCCCPHCSPCDGDETPESCCIDCGGCDTIQTKQDCEWIGWSSCNTGAQTCGPGIETHLYNPAKWGGEDCEGPATRSCYINCCGNGVIDNFTGVTEVCDTAGPTFANTCSAIGCYSCSRQCNDCTSVALITCSNCGDGIKNNHVPGYQDPETCDKCAADMGTCQCQGSNPTSATMCSSDDEDLVANWPKIIVTACTDPVKCEFTCDSNYHINGSVCENDECTGIQPSNSTQCDDDWTDIGGKLTIDVLADSTDCSSRKCEVYCNAWHRLVSGTQCVKNQCIIGTKDVSNATLCTDDDKELTSDVGVTITTACNDTIKCEYKCNTGFIKIGGVCRKPECTGTQPPVANSVVCNANEENPTDNIYTRVIVDDASCDAAANCQYKCANGYVYSGGTCKEICNTSCTCSYSWTVGYDEYTQTGEYHRISGQRQVRTTDSNDSANTCSWTNGKTLDCNGLYVSFNIETCDLYLRSGSSTGSVICSKTGSDCKN